jgi:esterase/lipase superfamily enzyme
MTHTPRVSNNTLAALLCALPLLLCVTGCEHTGLMKTPNLYLHAEADPYAALPESRRTVDVNLIYATDRAPLMEAEKPQGTGNQYGHGRSDNLFYGRATVALGDQTTWDEIHAASLTRQREHRFVPRLTRTTQAGRFPAASKSWRMEEGAITAGPSAAEAATELGALVAEEMAGAPRREAFVFVHGYNNQFYHSALTMAQLWHFMGRPGVPVIYSWPAGHGGLRGYTADSESSQYTIFHMKQFLRALAATPGLEKIHILAHSRGTDVVTSAIRELMLEYRGAGLDTRQELKLGNLVLAAPDLNLDIVNQSLVAEGMIFVPERFTIYLSKGDRALRLSSWLTSSVKRLGSLILDDLSPREQAELTSLPNTTFIDADVESDITGHAYFWINPAASSDVILLLRDNADPGAEHGRPLVKRSENFWLLREDYLRDGPSAE